MKKRIYDPPCCTLVQVVLEEGLCASSGDTINDVTVQATENNPLVVDDYQNKGSGTGYFNDIGFE